MQILVCEYGCSCLGPYSMTANYLVEGFAMLRTLASDLSASGHEVTVLLHKNLKSLSPLISCNRVVTVHSGTRELANIASRTDGAYLIAPETDNLMAKLISNLRNSEIPTFNSTPEAIAVSSNKWLLHRRLTRLKIPAPKTVLNRRNLTAQELVEELGLPLLAKPVYGAGCQNIRVAETISSIEEILKTSKADGSVIFQKFLKGISASVSLLCGKNKAEIISVNRQYIEPNENRLEHLGGEVPLKARSVLDLCRQAKKIVRGFKGLRGYVGIDLILTTDGPFFLEVNPRLTSSFVGISTVYGTTVADGILRAESGRRRRIGSPKGTCVFRKVECGRKIRVPENLIVTPPIFFSRKKKAAAFLKAHSSTSSKAWRILGSYCIPPR